MMPISCIFIHDFRISMGMEDPHLVCYGDLV